ncbi:hypothetical protein EDB74_105248 [Vibrio crassostreae]|nr:hypothetical protein EDB74_105248 [Vibrio crassostreae]
MLHTSNPIINTKLGFSILQKNLVMYLEPARLLGIHETRSIAIKNW